MKTYCNVCDNYKKLKNSKLSYLFAISVIVNMKKNLKKKNELKYQN